MHRVQVVGLFVTALLCVSGTQSLSTTLEDHPLSQALTRLESLTSSSLSSSSPSSSLTPSLSSSSSSSFLGTEAFLSSLSPGEREGIAGEAEQAGRVLTQGLTGAGAARLMGAALFGLVNGFTLGLAGGVRAQIAAIARDSTCAAGLAAVSSSAASAGSLVVRLVRGVVTAKAREGKGLNEFVRGTLDALLRGSLRGLVAGVFRFSTTCAPFKALAGMLAAMILVGLAMTLLLWAMPGLGWVAWLVGVVGTLFAGLPFLWRTLRKVGQAVRGRDTATVVEGVMEVVGAVACILFTTGANKLLTGEGRAQVAAKLTRSELTAMFKNTLKPNPKLVETFERFSAMMKRAQKGGGSPSEVAQLAKEPVPAPAEQAPARDTKRDPAAAALEATTPEAKAALYDEFRKTHPGEIFGPNAPKTTLDAVQSYTKGTKLPNGQVYGGSVKNLDLTKISADNIDQVLSSKGFKKISEVIRDPKTQEAVLVNGKPVPMDVYIHDDGSMIRFKPLGQPNSPRTQAHAVKAVRWPPDGDYKSFAQEAFKVDKFGNPLPKSPGEAFQPFPNDKTAGNNFFDGWAEMAHAYLKKK